MQVEVNRKERANAKWRFAGLYILSVAIPALLIINGLAMGKVECKENKQLVAQLKKRDQALAGLSQLAAVLNQTQELMPAYAQEPTDQAKFDSLIHVFDQGVARSKNLYYSDRALYKYIYDLILFLETNQKESARIRDEFQNKVADGIRSKLVDQSRNRDDGGGGNQAEVEKLEGKLQNVERMLDKAMEENSNLKKQVADIDGNSDQLKDLRNRARGIDENIDQINVVLAEIEQDCNGIERRGNKNAELKNKILEKVRFLKSHVSGIKNTNKNLVPE